MSGLWRLPSILVVTLLGSGVLGAYSEVLSPLVGFYLFLAGAILAMVSAVTLAGAGAFASATGRAWRGAAARAALIPVVAMLAIVIPRLNDQAPMLNDVSTDLDAPPTFAPDVAAGPAARGAAFRALQEKHYPDIQPLRLAAAPEQAFEQAQRVARAMPGWLVTETDPARGTIRAEATSTLFKFVDDVLIRVRPEGPGARIDMRSRSRVGRSDMGANAERIHAYQAALRQAVR